MIQNQLNLQILYTDARLADLFQALDQLHSAASEGQLHTLTPLPEQELLGWLRDLIYTAQETINEIDNARPRPEAPLLRVIVPGNFGPEAGSPAAP